jgi:uncharacterized protein (DUF2267 family)
MGYEEFVVEVRRRAGPVSRYDTERVTKAYLETLRERLSGERSDGLAAHLPKRRGRRVLRVGILQAVRAGGRYRSHVRYPLRPTRRERLGRCGTREGA